MAARARVGAARAARAAERPERPEQIEQAEPSVELRLDRPTDAARPGRRAKVAWLSVAAAALVVVLIGVGLGLRSNTSHPVASDTTTATSGAAAAALAQVVQVGQNTSLLAQIGSGTSTAAPHPVDGSPLALDGKPEVLYIGAEYCPFCAAERWALVLALSRFGTFDQLGATASSSDDVDPGTPSFTFHGSSYSSDVLAFVGVEVQDSSKAPFDSLTPAEEQLSTTYGQGEIPFVDIGGRYVITGATYDIGVLARQDDGRDRDGPGRPVDARQPGRGRRREPDRRRHLPGDRPAADHRVLGLRRIGLRIGLRTRPIRLNRCAGGGRGAAPSDRPRRRRPGGSAPR